MKTNNCQQYIKTNNYIAIWRKKYEEELSAEGESQNSKFQNRLRILEKLLLLRPWKSGTPHIFKAFRSAHPGKQPTDTDNTIII